MRYGLSLLAIFSLLACEEKHKNQSRGRLIEIAVAESYVVPKDSIVPPKIFPASESKMIPFSLGEPQIGLPEKNVFKAGEPIITPLGKPEVKVPGQGDCGVATEVSIADTVIIAREPKMIEAKEMARKDHNPMSVAYYGKVEGLPHDVTTCLLQDRRGNIWLGTNGGGVVRFDGKQFFQYSTLSGLIDDNIFCIKEDHIGNIWFGTAAGFSRFDGKRFANYEYKQNSTIHSINSIAEDATGNIWLGTSDGALRYDGKSFRRFDLSSGLKGALILSVFVDSRNNVWFGALDGGLTKFDGNSFTHYNQQDGLISDRILCINEDAKGIIWLGTINSGLVKFDQTRFSNFTTDHGLIANGIGWIEIDQNDKLWLGSQMGACSFDGEVFTHYGETQGMSSKFVYGVLTDNTNNIWVATAGGGLCRIDGTKFIHYGTDDGIYNSVINSILMNLDSTFWIGSENGLNKFDEHSFDNFLTQQNSAEKMFCSRIMRDAQNRNWIFCLLSKYKSNIITGQNGQFKQLIISDLLTKMSQSCAAEDKAGNIWMGTIGDGLIKFDGTNFYQFKIENGLSHNDIKCILPDSKGNIWIGTAGGGINKFDGTNFHHFKGRGLANSEVLCALEDAQQRLWFGLGGNGGLVCLEGNSFLRFTTNDGLSNDNIFSFAEEQDSDHWNLWIGTRQGISKLALNKINNLLQSNGRISDDEILFETFDERDGFVGVGCNHGAMLRIHDGTFLIGANNLLTRFNPRSVESDSSLPIMQITGIDLFNERINWTEAIAHQDSSFELKNGVLIEDLKMDSLSPWNHLPQGLVLHHQNNVTFRFIGTIMNQPWKVKYRYKLSGYDQGWSTLSSSNFAHYGKLPAGTYTFTVKAMGSNGQWSKPAEFTFQVRPPWWNNMWSYMVYALAIFFNIVIIFRWRVSSLKDRQKKLEIRIKQATQVIVDQKTEVEKQKDLAEAQKFEAEEQRKIAQEQKLLVEEQNKEILDSIEYAKRIQTAILPPSKTVAELLKDSFVLYLPKDIVAGDFYWMDTLGDDIYFAACDCTGHGVPGAMVSVICNYVLNTSVNEFSLRSPGAIFDKSRELLVENFAKSDEDVKDGMDASMCALNFKNMTLQWSGANNPLWIYRIATGTIEEYKPDKQPIGKGYELKPFTTHDIVLNSGDIIYVFTDGYADQFGGERNKKLTRSKFRELLLRLAQLPMDQQRNELLDFHNQYRGSQEQVDDICVIGVRV